MMNSQFFNAEQKRPIEKEKYSLKFKEKKNKRIYLNKIKVWQTKKFNKFIIIC